MRPSASPPGKRVVLHKLVEEVNPTHVLCVVPDDGGALDRDLLVDYTAVTSPLPLLDVVLGYGLMTCGNHGDNAGPLPQDDEDRILTSPNGLSSWKPIRPDILPHPLEDLGCTTPRQPQGTTAVNPGVVEFLGQGHGVVVIVHEQVVSLVPKTIYEAEDDVAECRGDPGIDFKVYDVTSVRLCDEEYFNAVLLRLFWVVYLDGETSLVRHHPLIQREILGGDHDVLAALPKVIHHRSDKDEPVTIIPGYCLAVEGVKIPVEGQEPVTRHQCRYIRCSQEKTTFPVGPHIGMGKHTEEDDEAKVVGEV